MKNLLTRFRAPLIILFAAFVTFGANTALINYEADQVLSAVTAQQKAKARAAEAIATEYAKHFEFAPSAHAGPLTDFAENKIVDYLFRGQASGTPTTWFVALYTFCPTDSTAGTEVTNANGYARVSVGTNALSNWAATQGGTAVSSGTTGTTSNLAAINFATVITSSWGTVNCWGLVDSGTYGGGNLWVYAAATFPPTLTVGSTASFAIGTLTVRLDD